MKIKWLGHAAFVIYGEKTLVTDPYNPKVGDLPSDLTADVVTVSHSHLDHDYVEGVGGGAEIVSHAGQYNIAGFEIKGIQTFHDNVEGVDRGKNIVFVIKSEGLTLVHLGDLGHILTDDQVSEIGPIDILMIPVGGHYTIDAYDAVKVVGQLKPKIVLPMHYKPKEIDLGLPLAPVDDFIQALGWPSFEFDEFEATQTELSELENQVVILKVE